MLQNLISILSDDSAAVTTAYEILIYNVRAFLFLSLFLCVLRFFKTSASTRHFLLSIALVVAAFIPVATQLIPEVDITIDSSRPIFLEALKYEPTAFTLGSTQEILPKKSNIIYLVVSYIAICLLLISKIIFDNLRIFLLLKLSNRVIQKHWQDALEKQCLRLGVQRKVSIWHSEFILSPSTWGVVRPVILIPNHATQWPDHLIESTLLHELAHIKRNDSLTQQFAKLICAVYWINPLFWKFFNHICNNAETACDNNAISSGVGKTQYANDLLHVAEHLHSYALRNPASPCMAADNKGSQLSQRIHSILNPSDYPLPSSRLSAIFIASSITCLCLPTAALRTNFIERIHLERPSSVINTSNSPTMNFEDILPRQLNIQASDIELTSFPETINGEKHTKTVTLDKAPQKAIATPENNVPNSTPVNENSDQEGTILKHLSPTDFIAKVTDKLSDTILPKQRNVKLVDSKFAEVFAIEQLDTTIQKEQLEPVDPQLNLAIHNRAMVKNLVIPKYPRAARSKGIEGEVIVEYSLDKHGKVTQAQVVSSDSPKVFDRFVLNAIKKSTFSPSTLNGRAIETKGLVEKYVFVLES